MSKNEIAKKEATELSTDVLDFSADAGAGLEGADKDSFAIPFITLLQGLSPQLETVEGARPGLFINTITNELFDQVEVIPCAFQRKFLRWAPRAQGGGFKGEYNPVDVETGAVAGMSVHGNSYLMDVPEGATDIFDANGHPKFDHLSDTRNHFVLFKNKTGSWQPALVSLSSTQIKKSKRWISRIQGIELLNKQTGKTFNPPSFSHIYVLKSVSEENAKGKWKGVEVDMLCQVTDATVYARAKDFYTQVSSGAVEVAPPPSDIQAEANDNSGRF